jgi:hypothetical protein
MSKKKLMMATSKPTIDEFIQAKIRMTTNFWPVPHLPRPITWSPAIPTSPAYNAIKLP